MFLELTNLQILEQIVIAMMKSAIFTIVATPILLIVLIGCAHVFLMALHADYKRKTGTPLL